LSVRTSFGAGTDVIAFRASIQTSTGLRGASEAATASRRPAARAPAGGKPDNVRYASSKSLR